jgi:hypothetical protein
MARFGIRRLGVAGAVALISAGSALAYVCHPDPPGTQSLTVRGRLDGYTMTGSRVAIDFWARGCERRISWNPLALTASAAHCTGVRTGGGGLKTVARDGRFRVVLVKGSPVPDRPDRLAVYDARTGKGLHNWPLPARAQSLDAARGVALLPTSNGVYAVRLRDGQVALVGVKRRGDHPQIEPSGIVYQDDLYKRASRARAVLKFVPFATVDRALRPAGPLRVPATIGDFAMDGRSVIFAMRDPTGRCDRIGLWTIPWHYSTELMDEPPICPERHAAGGITALALGGQYFEVVTTYGNVQTLISSGIVRCIERIVTRARLRAGGGGTRIGSLAADGSAMAYALGPQRAQGGAPGTIGFLAGMKPIGTATSESAPVQLSADRGELAILRADGRVEVRSGSRVVATFEPEAARAVALRAGQLAVVTRGGRLNVYDVKVGRLLRSWAVPANASSVDVHYGVAVVSAGHTVLALRLATGRRGVLLRAPRQVRAHLDDVGVVYRYNVGRSGLLGFIPFASVERALR